MTRKIICPRYEKVCYLDRAPNHKTFPTQVGGGLSLYDNLDYQIPLKFISSQSHSIRKKRSVVSKKRGQVSTKKTTQKGRGKAVPTTKASISQTGAGKKHRRKKVACVKKASPVRKRATTKIKRMRKVKAVKK